jgi:SagB-type dehydrogenase family enzyme
MPQPLILAFKKGISINEQSGECVLQIDRTSNSLRLQQFSPGLQAVVRALCGEGGTEESLKDLAAQTGGISIVPEFYYYLEKFTSLGLICYTIKVGGESPLATLVPLSTSWQFQFREVAPDKQYALSRFAYCRKDNLQLVVECPLSHAQIILGDWRGAALLTELAQPRSVADMAANIPGISEETVRGFASLLWSAGMLSELQESGKVREEESETLAQWEFHDLLFHSRIRVGRHANPIGRTYRFYKKIEELPAVKPQVWNERIDLYKPDLEKVKLEDYPFTQILEERKSVRTYGERPITDRQLGEFLYRSVRVRNITKTEDWEISNRPYPNAGACYELEFYLAVDTCENLASGLYHYCPQDHQLARISGRTERVEALLESARINTHQSCFPQVLIVIAARFQRASWYYESLTYAGILKNVGVVYQTLYLVATAIGLAPCAIGSGNADLFAAAVGTDYCAESSVGEFALGSKNSP